MNHPGNVLNVPCKVACTVSIALIAQNVTAEVLRWMGSVWNVLKTIALTVMRKGDVYRSVEGSRMS